MRPLTVRVGCRHTGQQYTTKDQSCERGRDRTVGLQAGLRVLLHRERRGNRAFRWRTAAFATGVA